MNQGGAVGMPTPEGFQVGERVQVLSFPAA